ncbi:hypothetical protein NIIDMKKI_15470 [Mycobacterium kansasii]|uniref:Uncharacterized protein n=1 Tax=Mycobacterium kansasii TaxID=1768 RepID=A0A7G1I5T5_MYCKA|nr:hypothetical protein NIIDMKKI_15470 [Mycobacterium kansasii]
MKGGNVKTHITCPCGEAIVGKDEDELVELTQNTLPTFIPAWSTTATQSYSWRTDAATGQLSAAAASHAGLSLRPTMSLRRRDTETEPVLRHHR